MVIFGGEFALFKSFVRPSHCDLSLNFKRISSHIVTLIVTHYSAVDGYEFWEEHAAQLHFYLEDGGSRFFS
jgi:hypothetical protein